MLWMTGIGAEGGVGPEGKGGDGRGAYRNSVKSVHVVGFRQSAQSLVARSCRDAGAGGSTEWGSAPGPGLQEDVGFSPGFLSPVIGLASRVVLL